MTDTPAIQNRATWLDWVGVGAGIAALLASFLPWYRVAESLVGQAEAAGQQTWITVWEGNFLAWFPIVLLMAVSVLLVWQRFGKPVQMVTSLWLTLALLAVVMILLRWITLPEGIRSGFGLYLGLIVAVCSVVAGFLAFRGQERANQAG
ncbi:magnesium-transporting ATPase (P-type) [Kibdelosporangium banguiense]|uniref:Magnesium-transporting ATPase (P-type) n=1 Tax=Kibdelosporangium banguiense TaxID=1365924 RepID=A0ABS4TAU4_9PSEU|nr:hypothetical protein [Kibdelosporangium banguiense]MBP2321084.1 magnesium-transporting ATPase (P-type) [Kibdelosporangium banguiense]